PRRVARAPQAGLADPQVGLRESRAVAGTRIPRVFRHHVIRREQRVQRDPETVFGFFADAGNLESITPPWLSFHIVTPRPIEMRQGALLEDGVNVHRLPVRALARTDSR